jgi:formate-dependent nitrite reductase membrane component NrfD
MTWSWAIYLYLWMAGMAGGAYFASFMAERFAGLAYRRLLKLATCVGIPLAVVGVILLVVELGQPIRFWHLFTQFDVASPMSMGTWILLIWVAIAVIMVILWFAESRLSEETASSMQRLTNGLGWIEVVFSVLLTAYTGVLLAVSNQSLWASSALLPALFVASAVSTGVAILITTALVLNAVNKGTFFELKLAINQVTGSTDWSIPNRTIGRLAEADAIVIIIELLVLIGYAIWVGTSSMMGAGDAIGLLIKGTLAVPFWLGVVLVALLIPLGLEITNWGKELGKKAVWRAIMASSACVVLGGLVLRAVIVVGGQL